MYADNLKIYASSAALTIEPQVTASGGVATIGIEAARRMDGQRTYDWSNKLTVQVTGRELPTVAAVLLGHQVACEFRFHGAGKNKSYALRLQGTGIVITVSMGGMGSITVPIEASDRFALLAVVLNQLQLGYQSHSSDALLQMLKQVYAHTPHSSDNRNTQLSQCQAL